MVFKGPLQSYGTDSHFEIRHSDNYPSKSAVLGLIAAAAGIHREEEERLEKIKSLHVAIRVDQIGHIDKDYQIAAKYKANGDFDRNYVTSRYYLEDATFLVGVEGEDQVISDVYNALSNPYFQLFLGRRSCPINYDFLVGIYDGYAINQLHQHPWKASEWYQKRFRQKSVRLDIYADMACLPEMRDKVLRRDNPVSFSQLGRRHNLRFEVHERVDINNTFYKETVNETEHDVFGSLSEV